MSQVNLMGMMQPHPQQIYEDAYEKGERILPRQDGGYTLFSAQRISSKNDPAFVEADKYEPVAGMPAPYRVAVVWLAADDEAIKANEPNFRRFQAMMMNQQRQLVTAPGGLLG